MSTRQEVENRMRSVLTGQLSYTGRYVIDTHERQDFNRVVRHPMDMIRYQTTGTVPMRVWVTVMVERNNPLPPAGVGLLRTIASNMDARFDYRANL